MNQVIMYSLAAMVLLGLVDFFIKKAIGSKNDGNSILFFSMLIAAIPFGVLALLGKVAIEPIQPLVFYTLIISALMFLGTIALLTALKTGEASIVVPIGRLGFVVTAICAFIFLSEEITITRGLGILCAIIAIILLVRE